MLVMTRRTFTLGATGLAALGRLNARGKIPIAVQLWSVRKLCEKDLAGTLAGLAKAGYQGVEFAGYYGRTAKELRKLLDDNGLRCCGTHTALNTLLGDELPRTIEFNQILGNRNLVVPSLPEKYRSSRQAWIDTAKLFAELADKVRPHKMRVGYHNHMVEFKPVDGEVPWDIFFQNTSKDVIMQIDTGNCMMGGGDPIAYVRKYPGRAITVHIKEYSASKRDALIGEGDVNWKEFFAACESVGGTEWYIVEEESGAYPGLEAVTRSLQNLRKMGK
jgi:sugar phosphate isomerase/epimerase